MGWTDLFKSKTARLKPDPRIRWFGKLPTYPDYYSSAGDEEWAIEFTDWVLKGFERYRNRVSGAADARSRMPVSSCAIRLPKSEMTVFASILDFGGDMRGRPFPICFYAGVPSFQWPGPTSDMIDGGARAMRDLLALRDEVGRFLNTPGHFETIFADREVDLDGIDGDSTDRSWVEAATKLEMEQWFAGAASGLKVAELPTWLRLASGWGDALVGHESKEFEPTLRFPLAAGVSSFVQIAGWLHWLGLRIDLRRRLLSLFVCGDLDCEPGYLTVVVRGLMADDFLLSTSRAGTLPYLDDACALETTDGAAEREGANVPAEPACATWAEFVGA